MRKEGTYVQQGGKCWVDFQLGARQCWPCTWDIAQPQPQVRRLLFRGLHAIQNWSKFRKELLSLPFQLSNLKAHKLSVPASSEQLTWLRVM